MLVLPIRERVGRAVRAARKTSGLSQAKLAEAAGLTWEYVSRLERATMEPGIERLERIAAALGVPLASLLGPEPESEISAPARRVAALIDALPERRRQQTARAIAVLLAPSHAELDGAA